VNFATLWRKRYQENKMKIVSLIISGIGLCMLSIAALLFVSELMFLSKAEETIGTVTGYGLAGDSGESDYCTQVEFTANDGTVVNFEASECHATRSYEIGESVTVYYDPTDPQRRHEIKEFSSQYLGPVLLGLCASPFILFGILGLLFGRLQRKVNM
jgi:hypothetical protein